MIQNDAIRTQVANTVVDQLYGNVDVEAAIADRLPPAQRGSAPVLAGVSRSGAYRAAEAVLERPRVQQAWILATTAADGQLVRLLDDKSKFVKTEGGRSCSTFVRSSSSLATKSAVIGRVAQKLPDSAGRVVIIKQSQLQTAQTGTKILRAVANWMWLVALAVAALAVWLARGRRRIELRALAIGVLVVGLLTPRHAAARAATSSDTSSRTTAPSRRDATRGAS